jgi:hypothetical protein
LEDLLDHLGRDTLPRRVVNTFIHWCIWAQARPAMAIVLERAGLTDIAVRMRDAGDLAVLTRLGHETNQHIRMLRGQTAPLLLSAAEAAAFEFNNLTNAASEEYWDAEGVAFFAARVCGWASWADTDFTDPTRKAAAERIARKAQVAELERLLRETSGD